MDIDLRANAKTFDFCNETTARTNILYGGAGSGKSWSSAMHLLFERMMHEKDIRILVTRKTRPALKKSCWLLVNDLLRLAPVAHTKNLSDLTIGMGTNEMFFTSIDDPEKLKSFERINYVWAEEATELTYDDFMQLQLRCRGENSNGDNQLYFSFNPIDEMSFWKKITDNPPESTAVNHSTYKDNYHLDKAYVAELERLIDTDETYHKIYTLGLWATPENIIYSNWDIVDQMIEVCDERIWGLDFGYSSNETALVECRFKNDDVWEKEHLYETHLTNPELIGRIKEIMTDRTEKIIADSAEPKSIQELKNAGLNVFACKKGKDSIRHGIQAVKSFRTHLSSDSINLIKEKRNYKWKEDRNGKLVSPPVPAKFKDHLMDAERYAISRIRTRVSAGLSFFQPKEKREEMNRENVIADRYGIKA